VAIVDLVGSHSGGLRSCLMLIEVLFFAREVKFMLEGRSKHGVRWLFFIVEGDYLSLLDGDMREDVNEALSKLSLLFKLLVLITLSYSRCMAYFAFSVC
jgi:hypothetical protein